MSHSAYYGMTCPTCGNDYSPSDVLKDGLPLDSGSVGAISAAVGRLDALVRVAPSIGGNAIILSRDELDRILSYMAYNVNLWYGFERRREEDAKRKEGA